MLLPLDNSPAENQTIRVLPIAAALGAEVEGVDLRHVTAEQFSEMSSALFRHGLLVFRDQALSHGDQDALTRRFGEHGVDAFTTGVPEYRHVAPVLREPGSGQQVFFGEGWHTDSPFLPQPPSISMLRSVEVPPWGGDTLFTSTRQAYESLSDGMKDLLLGCRTLFSRTHISRNQVLWKENTDLPYEPIPVESDLVGARSHPLVRTHPVTGHRALYLDGTYSVGIDGLRRAEAEPVLRFLLDHITSPEFHCRIRWTPNMLAIWDNRLVLHRAFSDPSSHRREMYRTTVLGEVPS